MEAGGLSFCSSSCHRFLQRQIRTTQTGRGVDDDDDVVVGGGGRGRGGGSGGGGAHGVRGEG